MASKHEVAQQRPSARIEVEDQVERSANHDGNAPDPRDWLAALIYGSDDAIISKDLDGITRSWNGGATHLFGYSADEVIGKSIAILIPEDLLEEEARLLAQIQCGQHVERLETKRRRKDGSLVDISLTVSPICSADGVIVGASTIACDITERLKAQDLQRLLMEEMRHRVKNLFTLAGAVVSISAKLSGSARDIIDDIRARLLSLARAHDTAMAGRSHHADNGNLSSLLALIHRILDPFATADGRVVIVGSDCDVAAKAVPYVALLLHELATNAAKFGSLSVESGRLDIVVATDGGLVRLVWRETGGPAPLIGGSAGFGASLERSVTCALKSTIERDWRPTGLVATIAIPRAALTLS